jgi:NAD(P)-dependent dehydrogenase (short-subunit alcohol dehydrogenase family)
MGKQFDGKVAVITGGASGIGRATALAFAAEGAQIIVSDVAVDGGQETVQLIEQAGGEARFIKADVTEAEEVEALVQGAVATYGRLDFGINNAGVGGQWGRVSDCDLAGWEQVIKVNLNGVFYCMHYELKQMLQQGGGAIVNTASIAGLRGLIFSSAYSASKHGVIGLTKAAALEYARKNIRINAVCPAFTQTPMFEQLTSIDPTYEEKLKRNIPMKRFGAPSEIAEAILWLCSDASGFMTGQALPLDGGMTAG